MHLIAVAGAVVAALIHVWFFAMESLWFMRPAVWRRFGLASEADAKVVRSWAFNQPEWDASTSTSHSIHPTDALVRLSV